MVALSTSTIKFIPNMQGYFKDKDHFRVQGANNKLQLKKSNMKSSCFKNLFPSVTPEKWMAALHPSHELLMMTRLENW